MNEQIVRLSRAYWEARAGLAFLDANLWLGRPRSPEFIDACDLGTLQQRLARYQMQGGVVSHFAALTYSPSWGNQILLEQVAETELWAGVVLVPEMFEPEEAGWRYLDGCLSRRARLARVFPRSHNFCLRSWCSEVLLQALADRRLPLSIWHTEVSWEEIRSLCQAYPELPVILEGTPLKILYYNRLLYPLLAQCPNLRLELHSLVNYLGIEDITNRFGARRLVFGSFMPVCDPNAAMMQVTHARISEEDKVKIARENLMELVAGVQVP